MGAVSNILKRKLEYTNDYEFIEAEIDLRMFQKCACVTNLESFKRMNYFSLSCGRMNKFIVNKHLFIKRKGQNVV